MHTAFSSPSSAPAAPLMPVSDAVQERFIRLPEVMHLCGLSRSTITTSSAGRLSRNKSPRREKWRGRSLKSPGGWLTVSPNATGAMTHDDARPAKSPFFWLAPVAGFLV
jgi:prophage regulatory protein